MECGLDACLQDLCNAHACMTKSESTVVVLLAIDLLAVGTSLAIETKLQAARWMMQGNYFKI